ncbi:hypothetical protein PGTUg99_015784 [Puccinia graminis f. sp. tritici]|uniref:Uncharacterized protein n=2 Tax=Puccinia graminis f. sp. tritici TaxID=56615 RepID=A0A5B0RZ78_PUCGR|nr:hypothetical protein PGTUg99_015784 [Puccinia graminis f. sp. tritici]
MLLNFGLVAQLALWHWVWRVTLAHPMVMSDLDSSQNDIDVVLKREILIGQKPSRNFQADSYQENFPDERSHRTDLAWCDPHQKNMGMNFEPNGWKRKKLIRSHPGTSSNKHGIEGEKGH